MPISDEAVETEDTTEIAGSDDEAGEEETGIVLATDNPEISDTQDFSATSERLTIEQDKEVLKAQREKFTVIEPTALPSRGGNKFNVAEYALSTTHNVGEKKYKRLNPLGAALSKPACKRFRLPDDAQEEFLRAGGPKRDSKNLDPDGDGFACDWSPDSYRKLLN